MSNKPIRTELEGMGYSAENAPTAGSEAILYFRNQVDSVRKIKVTQATGTFEELTWLTSQNPTAKVTSSTEFTSCLGKGLIPSQIVWMPLDQSAHESAEAFIINPAERLTYGDYKVSVDGSDIDVTLNHGLGGQHYIILGFKPTNFDLTALSVTTTPTAASIAVGGITWSLTQLRNCMVYMADGSPIIPFFVKCNVTTGTVEAATPVAYDYTDISAAIGNSSGNFPFSMTYDWDGIGQDSKYEEATIQTNISLGFKALIHSDLNLLVADSALMTAFTSAGKIPSVVNTTLGGAAIAITQAGWSVGGTVNTPSSNTPYVAYAYELSKAARDQLALLQWSKPDLVVMSVGTTDYTVTNIIDSIITYNTTRYIAPLFLPYDPTTGNTQTMSMTWGWAGKVLNNEWSVETASLVANISVVTDPFVNALPATAFVVTDPTQPITITVNGVSTTYANYESFLINHQDYANRIAGLRLMTK